MENIVKNIKNCFTMPPVKSLFSRFQIHITEIISNIWISSILFLKN